ncbi:MAG TPA: hypothetical protein VL361_06710 [Candidatus Limnocylindrales bacterium]|nr:hypothetical protein [Candidatus Limnocylindrales bacterium]
MAEASAAEWSNIRETESSGNRPYLPTKCGSTPNWLCSNYFHLVLIMALV